MAFRQKDLPRPWIFPLAVNSNSGSILVITLWSISFLATLAVILGFYARQKTTLVRRLDERDKLYLIAEAGIKKAIMRIAKNSKEREQCYFALNDPLRNNPGAFKDIGIGDGQCNISYTIYGEQGAPETRWGVVDEEAKININKFDLPVLKRLFQIVLVVDDVEAQELAAAVIDWRDADNELCIPSGSAEDFYYKSLPHSYESKDAEFETLEEVLMVKDMTEEKFMKLKDYITIYGGDKVNVNTASRPVLLALGLREDTVDKIISFRCGEDKLEGTKDDNIFQGPSEIASRLSQAYHLSDLEIDCLNQIAERYLRCESEHFMIRSPANLSNKKDTIGITCVVDYNGKVLYWQRDN